MYYDYLGRDSVYFDGEGRFTIDGPVSDWISDKVFGILDSIFFPKSKNAYKEFLAFYSKNSTKFNYDKNFIVGGSEGEMRQRPNPERSGNSLFASDGEVREYILEDPKLLKLGKGALGAVGTPQSQREFADLSALTDVPGNDHGEKPTTINNGRRRIQAINSLPRNSMNRGMNKAEDIIGLINDGADAANRNSAVGIKVKACGNSIIWAAGERPNEIINLEPEEFKARKIVNDQYDYHNLFTGENLPHPF